MDFPFTGWRRNHSHIFQRKGRIRCEHEQTSPLLWLAFNFRILSKFFICFSGAAIMIIVDQDVSSNRDVNYDQLSQTATKGWLQCGVCNYISEIDNFAKVSLLTNKSWLLMRLTKNEKMIFFPTYSIKNMEHSCVQIASSSSHKWWRLQNVLKKLSASERVVSPSLS